MLYKVVLKNLKWNLKNYIIFFVSNIIAVAELFTFWGLRNIIEKAITDTMTLTVMRHDFWVSARLVTIVTMFLMIFSMKYYVKQRAADYSTFIMLGMKKRMCYLFMLAEYSIGWIFSFFIGVLIGNAALYGLQSFLYHLYPEFIVISKVGFAVYRDTFFLSAGIMAVVFIGLLTWMENKDLGALMLKEEVFEKKPVSAGWLIFSLIGIAFIGLGVDQLFHSDQDDIVLFTSSYIFIAIGGLLVLAFGCAVILEFLKKMKRFYIRRILKLNQLYNKYQSNILIIFILFVIHFFALTYIVIEITGILPLDKFTKNYPYDALWMAQPEDETYSERLAGKYGGTVQKFPMVRVTTRYHVEHIGISETSYEKMTGKSYSLKDKEILVGIEDQEYEQMEKIKDESYWDVYEWLKIGKYKDENQNINFTSEDSYHYTIKDIFTQSIIGRYSVDAWSENIIVFSDSFFAEQWETISQKAGEASMLELFSFPKDAKRQACKELEKYASKNGVEEISKMRPQKSLYITDQFLRTRWMQLFFNISSKLFILISLFISGIFVMGIKILSELPAYSKRYSFLECMGMRERERKKTIRFEVQSIFNIALGAGLVISIVYADAYLKQSISEGVVLGSFFWKCWGMIVSGYILIEYGMGRLYARYVYWRLRKEKSI